MQKFSLLLLLSLLFAACNTVQDQPDSAPLTSKTMAPGHFSGGLYEYWYEGVAELNTYDLQQIRYGEIHPGQATLIFVSEDFLTDKQVKNDNYTNPASTPIIKTNFLRRFTTGIYDYSVMTSVFTPTKTDEQPHTLKVTTGLQDWCGQTFTQLNHDGGGAWNVQLRSYFEREGDTNKQLPADFLEDEVFNRIRTGWENLPTGNFNVIPNTGYLLMTHQPYEAAKATVRLSDYAGDRFTGTSLKSYVVDFTDLGRKLEVVFEAASPYVIRGWTESYDSRGKQLTTVATLTHQVREPYWSQNSTADVGRRDSLGLPVYE
ncbi:hypothetical protein QWY85_03855 [Neolewinella lacunae]|uniref:Septum formation inhibitor Maf n=1 Tax=Neolewinella lacunae TaxID=1517758 RepID=A0A923PEX3_9BACT|nr:hypothetical protein [Neolewinella lacunae]MBC6992858.1 hypothetical protein [Neolewinella lacunae]MDN3633778.1 hypothetical protein [Neolewinella lacunae]